jgi:O-antigen/teichoic acid export membrane protein
MDKYFIVGGESFHRLSFYTIPFEVITGIWIIPSSIAAVVYPAFSYYRENASVSEDLLHYSSKYIMVLMLPLIAFLFMFSEEVLLLWQGAEVARNSAGVLRILLLGVFINSISWVPGNMLTGQGRPDIVAKIHMAQIPLYIVVAYFLIRKYSIGGAAVAFTLRVSFETLLILCSLRGGIVNFFRRCVSGRMICVAAGLLLLNALYKYVFPVNLHIFAYLAVYLLVYVVLFWRLLLIDSERVFIRDVVALRNT